MHETPRARLVAYGVAVLVVAVSFLIRWLLRPVLGDAVPTMFYFPAIVIAAYYGGLGPGLLTTVLAALLAFSFPVEPAPGAPHAASDLPIALAFFLLVGTIISGLSEALHRAHRRILAHERRQAEEALSQERYLLHALMDNLPDAIYFKDAASRFLRINKALANSFGLGNPAQAIGKTDFDFFTEEHARPAHADEQEIIRTGRPLVGKEEKETWRDGRVRWVSTTKMPFRDKDGTVIGTFGVARDITRLKLAERALRESEQRWRSLTEALPQLVWSATPDGACDYFSTQWTEHTGAAEAGLLGWRWLEVLHPEDRAPTRQLWLESVAGRRPYDVEYRVRRRDGEYRWFKTRGVPIRDGSGGIVKWFGTCTDITDLRQAEEALRAGERRFRVFVDHAADAFFLHDEGTARVLDVNRRACESLGYTRDELIGMTPFDLDPDLTPARVEDRVRRLLAGETIAFEARHRRKDGTVFPVEVRGKAFRECGRGFLLTLVRDITDRKRAEEALRESEEQFRGTFENAAVGIAHTDFEGRWLRVNQKFCAILGYAREELFQKAWQDLTHPEDVPASFTPLASLLLGERSSYALEKRYVRKDGSLVWADLAVSLQRDAAGKPAYVIAVIQDTSERKRLEGELRQAVEAAEAASRAKGEFLAHVSHEIRTPMNAILGLTELVLDTPLTGDQRQCLKTVKSAADNLLGIIDDLLDFAKIEAGRLELDAAGFSLRAALGDVLGALGVRAREKRLRLVCHVQPEVPDALVGDAGRLRQVLLNLVGNAVKFTERGEVVVSVKKSEDRSQKSEEEPPGPPSGSGLLTSDFCLLEFSVRDTGIGIPPESQERIFRAFEQEDSSTTRKYGGTGLGLAIASRLVALMGGQIGVDSQPGRGSTFTFTARFLTSRPAEGRETEGGTRPVPAPASRPLRILVAEDNDFNTQLLEQLLARHGHRVRVAGNGREALALLGIGGQKSEVADERASPSPTPDLRPPTSGFDLLLLDVHMPELDGFQVIRAVRERERAGGGHLPVIALTARSRKEDREQCLAAGMDDFLTKPVRAADLLEAIDRVLAAFPPAGRAPTEAPSPQTLLDPGVIRAACGDDGALLGTMCRSFQARLPGLLEAVQAALRDRDAPRLREAAHKLRGMIAAFSPAAGAVAANLEDQAALGRLEEARPLVGQLETMARELLRLVDGLSLESLEQHSFPGRLVASGIAPLAPRSPGEPPKPGGAPSGLLP